MLGIFKVSFFNFNMDFDDISPCENIVSFKPSGVNDGDSFVEEKSAVETNTNDCSSGKSSDGDEASTEVVFQGIVEQRTAAVDEAGDKTVGSSDVLRIDEDSCAQSELEPFENGN